MTSIPQVSYPKGTRRLEEMIAEARRLSFQENYSYTEGWDDNTVANIFNLGLDRLYASLTEIDNPANIQEVTMGVIAQQQAYDLPIDILLAIRIMDMRYQYGEQTWEFITLRPGMIQDRFSYPTNIPDTYAIRNGQILLSPTPNLTKQKSLIINYQQRMRALDVRRGKVSSVSSKSGIVQGASNTNPLVIHSVAHGLLTNDLVSLAQVGGMTQINGIVYTITKIDADNYSLNGVDGTNLPVWTGGGFWFQSPIAFQLNFTVDSQKDINLHANADSILDKVDWACFCDRYGNPVIDAIPLSTYNFNTFVLTADQSYAFEDDEYATFSNLLAAGADVYVVTGDFSSSHSILDRQCEDHLIEYSVLRLLRLQSAAEPTVAQLQTEEAVLQRLIAAYRRYRPSVMPVIWQERLRPRSWPWGRRGMY